MTDERVISGPRRAITVCEGRRQGRGLAMRQDIEFALKRGKTVFIASPKEGGGIHWTTVVPFRRREEWR